MKKIKAFVSALALAALAPLQAQAQEPIKLAALLEMSGAIASSGTQYYNGMQMAAKEINDSGGVLGHKFDITLLDTQSNPGISKAMAAKAVDMDVFAVVGPTLSGAAVVSLTETRRAEIPNFTGAASALVTSQGNPYVIRTNSTQSVTIPKVTRYIKDGLKAKTASIIWVNTEFGKSGHDQFMKSAQALGIKVIADITTDQGQIDMSSAVVAAKRADADVLFAYTNEEESAHLAKELRKQGFAKPIVGDGTLISQKVIDLAGDAANGLIGHAPLTVDAPLDSMHKFDQKYTAAYKMRSDQNGIQGYMVPYIIKAVCEKIGKVDRKAFMAALKGMPLRVKDTPGLLMDMKYNDAGDADRESYLVEIKNGKQQIISVLPPANPI